MDSKMNFFIERSSHPSRDQIMVLLEFLERNPTIAKGFPKLPSARAAARKQWEKLAVRLNGIGGSLKSWKQWTKYWADKKSAVKKKAAIRVAARRRGDEEMTIELSEIEERILTLMVGVCAVGDRNLRNQRFEENTSVNGEVEGVSGGGYVKAQQSDEPLQKKEILDPLDVSMSSEDNQSCVAETSYVSDINYVPVPLGSPTADATTASPSPTRLQNDVSREPTPIKRERSPLRHTIPRRLRPRRRLMRVASPPPSQWQMQFATLTDRSLRMEEQRLELDRRHTDIMETVSGLMGQLIKRDAERERLLAQAVASVGEGLKLLANALKK